MRLSDIVGNDNVKIQLTIASEAARINNNAMPHTLFTGPAGCGKTTMSKAIALHQGSKLLKISPESLKFPKDVYAIAEQLSVDGYTREGLKVGIIKPTIVFIDEIHRVPISGQEALGVAMEEHYLIVKNQYTGESWDMWLPNFTIMGATTLAGRLSKPFRDRFKLIFQFKTYTKEEAVAIILRHAQQNNMSITLEAAILIAERGRGVPRLLVNFLHRVWDSTIVLKKKVITPVECVSTFNIMGIDHKGLTNNDIKCLKSMYEIGIPIGLDTLSVILNESHETIVNNIEPYLIQQGLLLRTPRGRMVSKQGIAYLKEAGYVETKKNFSIQENS